jgi:hypothetical protein
MTSALRFAILGGICAGALAGAGCSSSNGGTGSGGSGGHAGTTGSGGHAGSSSGGTSGGGSGGSAPACGATAQSMGSTTACTAALSMTAPTNGLIADFSANSDGGLENMGGITTYGGIAAPTYTTSTSGLNMQVAAAPSPTTPQYIGVVLYFNNCMNACAFSGIQFDIKGTISSGCTMQYSVNSTEDVCNDGTTNTDPKGSYTVDAGATCGAYSPQIPIMSSQITSTGTTMMMAFDDARLVGGVPSTAVDPSTLTAVQWQFTIPAAGDAGSSAAECDANVTVTNIKFY